MKTPFYIIKRTPVNKETALGLWRELLGNDDAITTNASDLIDFCLSGGTEEKVFIEPGMRVRIKRMPTGAFDYNSPGCGTECKITTVGFYDDGSSSFSLTSDEDYNCLHIKEDNQDLSEYLELV